MNLKTVCYDVHKQTQSHHMCTNVQVANKLERLSGNPLSVININVPKNMPKHDLEHHS